MRKKVDSRVRTLIENGVKTRHRTMLLIVGDNGKDQIVNLHYILSKCTVKTRPSVLWCYKKELGFTSHKKKRIKIIKKQQQRGLRDPDLEDPFELFITSTDIRYTYYKESHKILGNTYGMCVLQDFEALTPNILARTIETVEGGGLVIILLKTMSSLKQLYSMTMDVHSRLVSNTYSTITGRFNERFILSLVNNPNSLILDDELNILPVSEHVAQITAFDATKTKEYEIAEQELKDVKQSLKDTDIIGNIITLASTLDQARCILTCVDAIQEKVLRSTVSVTAARGRGKSAALGLAIAAAVAYGYSNIFVTSPSPENLKTLFDFVFKGFDALQYKEHMEYTIVESTNPDFNGAIVRVNIFRSHRQTIQYIQPQDYNKMGQTELLVIDEAAAIPLPIVKNLLGPYLVFLSSTINGYEGTGRSLSLKLIDQLRQQTTAKQGTGRVLKEVELKEPIRYAGGDPIEQWLNTLLCLDATQYFKSQETPPVCPHPSQCQLYYVNKDTLFSYHKASEDFLQRLVGLYVSSHYKNSPDDLLLMSDAPAHHLFVLLGPVDQKSSNLPFIFTVVQICLEGQIVKEKVIDTQLQRGKAAAGDLIPWTISQQFQDNEFPSLSGVRVVRIASHPDHQKMGYGSRALELLSLYYEGGITSLENSNLPEKDTPRIKNKSKDNGPSILHSEKLKPRENLPPLLLDLKDRPPERLHYMGVSFGLTPQLYNFWKKSQFFPLYLRQTPNDLTGEHTMIMLKNLKSDDLEIQCDPQWLSLFAKDFRKRFITLMSYSFNHFPASLCLSILNAKSDETQSLSNLSKEEMDDLFNPHDLKRLESYARNLLDYHVIIDLLPIIGQLFFSGRVPVSLSAGQKAIIVAISLQRRTVESISEELTLPVNQILALFNKAIRKISQYMRGLQEKAAEESFKHELKRITNETDVQTNPIQQQLDQELEMENTDEFSNKNKKKLANKHRSDKSLQSPKDQITNQKRKEFSSTIPKDGPPNKKKKKKSKKDNNPKAI